MTREAHVEGLDRASLPSRIVEVLSRGGLGNPDVYLVHHGDGFVVVKDFAPRPAWVRLLLGRWITRRELRAYQRLAGSPAVPRLLGSVDALAFALEYRPGRMLTRRLAGKLPQTFLAELREAIEAMHARGVVHLDLRHRSNLLAGNDGRPVLIDFASSVCFEPSGWLARHVLPWLAQLDRRALLKWEARLGRGA